jgi:hypothetical protein
MAVQVVASSTTDTTQGTQNSEVIVAEPSGLATDDLIVLLYANENANTNDCPDLSGDGYTRITHGSNSQDCQGAIYWKVADGTETWPYTINAGSDYAVGWALRITGIDTGTPIHRTGSWVGEDTTGSSVAASQVNTGVNDCLGLAFAFYDGSDIAPASVSGTGWALEDSLEDPSNDANGAAADYALKDISTAGDTVDCTFTMGGTDGRMAIQIAIAPSSLTAKAGTDASSWSSATTETATASGTDTGSWAESVDLKKLFNESRQIAIGADDITTTVTWAPPS